VNHPEPAVWMDFLYGEIDAPKKAELQSHLDQCPACAAQMKTWQESRTSLDAWTVPSRPGAARKPSAAPLKWAAAAAVLLALGFLLGRASSRNAAEIAQLRGSVANLAALVQQQSQAGATNAIAVAHADARQLLADYARSQETQRADDRQALNVLVRNLDARIDRVHAELETVALNTQTGFEETHQALASFTLPSTQSKN
jgi:anti-sigma factor RsiW